jgi:hypothetical protein
VGCVASRVNLLQLISPNSWILVEQAAATAPRQGEPAWHTEGEVALHAELAGCALAT